MRSLFVIALALTFAPAGCAVDASSGPALDTETSAQDGQAVTAQPSSGKAGHFVGLYKTHAKNHEDGDFTSLELRTASAAGADTL